MIIGASRFQEVRGPGSERAIEVDVLSSAAAPPNSPYLFVFGASHGLFVIDKKDYATSWVSANPRDYPKAPKGVFAVEFLPQ